MPLKRTSALLIPCLLMQLAIILRIGEPSIAAAQADSAAQTDALGDALPNGAVARIGTVRADADLPSGFPRPASVRGTAFSADGKLLVTFDEPADPSIPRVLRLWDVQTGKQRSVLDGHTEPIRAAAFSPDGKFLVTSSYLPSVQLGETRIWDVEKRQLLHAIPEGGQALRFRQNGRDVAVAVGSQIRLYRVATGTEVGRFLAPNVTLALAADDRRLLAVSHRRDPILRLFDLTNGKELLKLHGCQTRPPTAAISRNGRTVAAADGGNKVLVWEVATGKLVFALSGHEARVLSLTISPDGRFLATGDLAGSVRLWEVATGREMRKTEAHCGLVTTLSFSRDGEKLVSGSTDKTALIWDFRKLVRSFLPGDPPDKNAFDELWNRLASAAPAPAYRAIGMLASHPDESTPYLEKRIRSILFPAENERIQQLIRELDDDDFVIRNRAYRELRKLRTIAKPVLLKEMERTTSAEVKYRIQRILAGTENASRFTMEDERRMARLVHVLDMMGGPASRAMLQTIIDEFPSDRIIRDVRQTLARLEKAGDG